MSTGGTLTAIDDQRVIWFTDYVHEGDHVEIYRTFEDAEEERGPSLMRVVCRDEDDWWLEPAPKEQTDDAAS